MFAERLSCGSSLDSHKCLWLWVPAQGRDDDEGSLPRDAALVAADHHAGFLLMLCAIISTPEELRTGPASSASSLIDVRSCAKRPATSNTEIGPAASSN